MSTTAVALVLFRAGTTGTVKTVHSPLLASSFSVRATSAPSWCADLTVAITSGQGSLHACDRRIRQRRRARLSKATRMQRHQSLRAGAAKAWSPEAAAKVDHFQIARRPPPPCLLQPRGERTARRRSAFLRWPLSAKVSHLMWAMGIVLNFSQQESAARFTGFGLGTQLLPLTFCFKAQFTFVRYIENERQHRHSSSHPLNPHLKAAAVSWQLSSGAESCP